MVKKGRNKRLKKKKVGVPQGCRMKKSPRLFRARIYIANRRKLLWTMSTMGIAVRLVLLAVLFTARGGFAASNAVTVPSGAVSLRDGGPRRGGGASFNVIAAPFGFFVDGSTIDALNGMSVTSYPLLFFLNLLSPSSFSPLTRDSLLVSFPPPPQSALILYDPPPNNYD
jgi:hypothetical protein